MPFLNLEQAINKMWEGMRDVLSNEDATAHIRVSDVGGPSGTQDVDIVAQTLGQITTTLNDALASVGLDQIRVDVVSDGSGTKDVDIVAQTTGNLTVDLVAQTLGQITTTLNDALTSVGTDQLRVDITNDNTGTKDVDIAEQSVGNLAVDVAAQTLGQLATTLDDALQSSGTLDQIRVDLENDNTGTKNVDITAQSVGNLAIDLAAQSVAKLTTTLDDALTSTGLDQIRVDLENDNTGTKNVDISAQSVGNLAIDLAAQSVAKLTTTLDDALTSNALDQIRVDLENDNTGTKSVQGSINDVIAVQSGTLGGGGEQALNPATSGVSADRCIPVVQNVGGSNSLQITSGTGQTEGIKLSPGESYEFPNPTSSTNGVNYVYSASGTDFQVTYLASS